VDDMWITVENMRNSGDSLLGISKAPVKGFNLTLLFPQSSPQLFIKIKSANLLLKWKEFCNYIVVIIDTHIFTAVITTNYKYKTFSRSVPLATKSLLSYLSSKKNLGAAL